MAHVEAVSGLPPVERNIYLYSKNNRLSGGEPRSVKTQACGRKTTKTRGCGKSPTLEVIRKRGSKIWGKKGEGEESKYR
jgi:hypothetical protein